MRPMLVMAACAVSLAACGGGGSAKVSTTTVPPPAAVTTTTAPQPSVDVQPASGPIGTSFQLLAKRFQPGEVVLFEIDFPSGKTFKGTVKHKAGADGSVIDATYRVTTGNPTGTYQVKAAGDKGTQGTGQFEVTAGGTVGTTATTTAGHTTTTAGHTTTTSGHTTTTKKP